MAKILVVDDDPALQRLLSLMLRRNDHEVTIASGSHEALQILENDPADLIIADLNMPEVSGFVLLQELRADERFQELPVIVLTASGQAGDQHRALQRGANGFLIKPTSSWELTAAVNRFLA